MRNVDGKKITVLGAANSGLAVASLLKDAGANVFVSETAPDNELTDAIEKLDSIAVDYEFGIHSDRAFEADFIVTSPGIPEHAPVIRKIVERGIPLYSEIECSSWFASGKTVAVTGSNGKTTTVSMLGEILDRSFDDVRVGGNIGTPFASLVHRGDSADTIYVLEVSSFQLRWIDYFHPDIAAILNISVDHLDWHPDMDAYVAAKTRILENMTADDIFIYNADENVTVNFAEDAKCESIPFSVEKTLDKGCFVDGNDIRLNDNFVLKTYEIGTPGMHNVANAAAAALMASSLGSDLKSIGDGLRNFKGVPHRLETVRTLNGVNYVNDSKATNVDSMIVALKSFENPVILIAGGRDKGADFNTIAELVSEKVKKIILLGEAADKIESQLGEAADIIRADTLEQAVLESSKIAAKGDVVLLSPGCSSFDMFRNYEERGEVFNNTVKELI